MNGWHPLAWAVFAAMLAGAGCGSASDGRPRAEAPALPPTDEDPPPWAPSPTEAPRTGEAVGIVTSGGLEQARAVVVQLIGAIRDGDRETLERILGDPIGSVRPQLVPPVRSRTVMLNQLLHPQARQAVEDGERVEALIDVDAIQVVPLAQYDEAAPLPDGYAGSDLLVTVPVRDGGARLLGVTLRWSGEGALVVRPGPEPRVVAL